MCPPSAKMPPGTFDPPLGNDRDSSPARKTYFSDLAKVELILNRLTELVIKEWIVLCSSDLLLVQLYNAIRDWESISDHGKSVLRSSRPAVVDA